MLTRLLFVRLRLHEGKVIKDRRHHLRTYPNCFVAKELIDWLIEHKEAMDRDTAIKIMQRLLDQSIVHHGEVAPCSSDLLMEEPCARRNNPTNLRPLLARVFLVCDEHREFKDLKLFYRFRKDDGTFPLDSEAKVFMRGQRIYEKYDHAQAHHAEHKPTSQACLPEIELRIEADILQTCCL